MKILEPTVSELKISNNVSHYDRAVKKIAKIGRICYRSETPSKMNSTDLLMRDHELVKMLFTKGHHSVFEHVRHCISFKICNPRSKCYSTKYCNIIDIVNRELDICLKSFMVNNINNCFSKLGDDIFKCNVYNGTHAYRFEVVCNMRQLLQIYATMVQFYTSLKLGMSYLDYLDNGLEKTTNLIKTLSSVSKVYGLMHDKYALSGEDLNKVIGIYLDRIGRVCINKYESVAGVRATDGEIISCYKAAYENLMGVILEVISHIRVGFLHKSKLVKPPCNLFDLVESQIFSRVNFFVYSNTYTRPFQDILDDIKNEFIKNKHHNGKSNINSFPIIIPTDAVKNNDYVVLSSIIDSKSGRSSFETSINRNIDDIKSMTFYIETNRGVLAELTRHRSLSPTVESTRYVNYSNIEKHGEMSFTDSTVLLEDNKKTKLLKKYYKKIEKMYNKLIKKGLTPQFARAILPNGLVVRMYVTGTINDWKDFIRLRSAQTAHPDIKVVSDMIVKYIERSSKTKRR